MTLIVRKYGGTSLGSIESIKKVARSAVHAAGQSQLIVVVSAMAGETDRLIALSRRLAATPPARELDVLLATGEQASASLLAIAIADLGHRAKSFLGGQIRITTDSNFSGARILDIDAEELTKALGDGFIAVVAGFQGVDRSGNVTTLGRGGSDTTATALAAATSADLCEIYTDVEGIFSADPRICPDARKLKEISYDEMLEMASLGAKVLHPRAVFYASKYHVRLSVRSSFNDRPGTLIIPPGENMEDVVVRGITCEKDVIAIRFIGIPDLIGAPQKIFGPISEAGIDVDLIIQNSSTDGFTDLSFTIPKKDHDKALALCRKIGGGLGAVHVESVEDLAKISVVGQGIRSSASVASTMFASLAEAGVGIKMLTTSEIKISCIIEQALADEAVRALHSAFSLDQPPDQAETFPKE
jgi:aspartate kinase